MTLLTAPARVRNCPTSAAFEVIAALWAKLARFIVGPLGKQDFVGIASIELPKGLQQPILSLRPFSSSCCLNSFFFPIPRRITAQRREIDALAWLPRWIIVRNLFNILCERRDVDGGLQRGTEYPVPHCPSEAR